MTIWEDIVTRSLAQRALDNERARYKRAVRRGRPRKVAEGESAQAKRRREYLEECGRPRDEMR